MADFGSDDRNGSFRENGAQSQAGETASVEALEDAVLQLFDDYRTAFDDFDAEAIADCFSYPAVIWQFGKGNVFVDEEELLENIDKLLSALDQEGVVNSDYEVVSGDVEGDAGLVTLAWTQSTADGEPVFEFTCHYHLIYAGTDWSIAMIVNEP
ncbi:MAG: hypothetical protein CMN86_19725 [Stappia sp.]|nr:hypothetical protein [Stappia sp.]